MKTRRSDVARDLEAESRITGRGERDLPQPQAVGYRAAGRRAVQRLRVQTGFRKQCCATAAGGIESPANRLDPGAERGLAATRISRRYPHCFRAQFAPRS